jgi:NADH:ubiquinone oxidoreductase subunit B-like Fe-S oxidoreductase
MIVAGRVNQKMAPCSGRSTTRCPIQMDHFDGCMRLSGGMFDNYWAIVQGG